MLGYQLLDMLAWVKRNGQGSIGYQLPRVPFSTASHRRLDKLLKSLEDWAAIIPKVQHLALESSPDMGSQAVTFDNSTTTEWRWTITNLIQASQHKGKAEWNKILTNFYSMAFIICWFSLVSGHTLVYN